MISAWARAGSEIDQHLQRQPNGWSCGPAALRHALLCHGVRASTRRLASLAGIDRAFTARPDADTAPGLQRAAKALGFRLSHRMIEAPGMVKLMLQNATSSGWPVLVCLDNWDHWVCVHTAWTTGLCVGYFDSSRDLDGVRQAATWAEFLHRSRWAPRPRWDLYPLVRR